MEQNNTISLVVLGLYLLLYTAFDKGSKTIKPQLLFEVFLLLLLLLLLFVVVCCCLLLFVVVCCCLLLLLVIVHCVFCLL